MTRNKIKTPKRILKTDILNYLIWVMILGAIGLFVGMVFLSLAIATQPLSFIALTIGIPLMYVGGIAGIIIWQNLPTTKRAKTQYQTVAIIGLLAGSGLFFGILGAQGGVLTAGGAAGGVDPTLLILAEFSKPPTPSLNETIGLCVIRAYNGTNYIGGTVDLYWYDNESYYNTVPTNTTIMLNGSTWGVFNTSGYYPMTTSTVWLKGTGTPTGTPVENIVPAVLMANIDNITAEIVSINGSTALHYVANITDGFSSVRIRLTNLERYAGVQSYWGAGNILPRTALPPVQNTTLPSNVYIGASLWFTINGSIEDPQYRLSSGSFSDIYMWQPYSWCNSTPIDFLTIEHEFIIKGNWTGVTGIRLSDMFMDNILDRYIIIA
jgi:hypothetical protein